MIKPFSKKEKDKEIIRIFDELADSLLKYMFSFWFLALLLNGIFFILMQSIYFANSEFFSQISVAIMIRIIISSTLIILIYIYTKKFRNKNQNLSSSHDHLIIVYCLIITILNLYKNYHDDQDSSIFEKLFNEQFSFLTYFIPWTTIYSKNLKIFALLLNQFIVVIIEILFNPQGNIHLSKGFIFLICNIVIDIKISGFNQIYLDQMKKSFIRKADEKICWRKIIEQMPKGFILISLKKKKIVFLNNSAMKLFDIDNSYIKKECFDLINQKLGILVERTRQECNKSENREPMMMSSTDKRKISADQSPLIGGSKEFPDYSFQEKWCLIDIMDYYLKKIDLNTNEETIYLETKDELKRIALKIDLNIKYKGKKCFSIYLEDMSIRGKKRISKLNLDFQNRIIKSFSHELKTPLNCAVPSLEMALYSLRPEEKIIQENLVYSLKSLKILGFVLNSIIDLSSLISNQFFLNLEKINIQEFINDMISILEPQASRRNLRIILKKESIVDDFMYSDKQRISIILYNLLSNAIKFTFQGEIIISIMKMPSENRFKFYIMDTGIGMKSEMVEKMNFYFSQKQTADIDFSYFNDSNICFGLNASNKIAHQINEENNNISNGLLIESSREDKGTIFSFQILNREYLSLNIPKMKNELVITDKTFHQKTNSVVKKYESHSFKSLTIDSVRYDDVPLNLNQKNSDNKKPFKSFTFNESKIKLNKVLEGNVFIKCSDCPSILVVDDDPFNQLTLEFILKKFKIKSERANNGQEAVKILNLKKTDNKCKHNCFGIKLIFMDYEMPIMNGVESTIQIKKLIYENYFPSLKIVGCTAFDTKMEIEKFYNAGIDDLVLKPMTIQKIKEQLVKWNLIQE